MLHLLANDTDPCIWFPPQNMKSFVGGVLTEWDWEKPRTALMLLLQVRLLLESGEQYS